MPHSLRAKLSGLRYKGILEDKDYKRLCKTLDNEDVLDKIRAEIASLDTIMLNDNPKKVSAYVKLSDVREVIDKYR